MARAMGVTDINRIYTESELARGDNIMFAATGVTNGDMLRVERAYFTWHSPKLYLSIGRRPSTGGAPLNFRNDEPRGGSPLGSVVNFQFDGATLGWHISEQSTFRLCYGVGYESGWGNGELLRTPADRLSDASFFGFNWDIVDTDELFIQATALRAPGGSVTWQGIDWSATLPDGSSQIAVRMYCGEAGSGGSVLWQYAGQFTLAGGGGSADFAGPCAGEFVRCEVDRVAGLDASPVLDSLRFRYAGPAAVGDEWRPPGVRLDPNVPNPFRSRTALRFEIASAARVRLTLHDLAGREVRGLVDARLEAGAHAVDWDGRDADGRRAPPGAYLARLAVDGTVAGARLVLLQ